MRNAKLQLYAERKHVKFSRFGRLRLRSIGTLLLLLLLFYILLTRLKPAIQHHVFPKTNDLDFFDISRYPYSEDQTPSVNLVVATTAKDDISWTAKIPIPNLKVLRYVSDSTSAEYRPPMPKKGREALIYLTYLHDFYDKLPDISIFIHSHESPWHIDGALLESLPFALTHLDPYQVQERRYFNLRVSWKYGCPSWIDTTNLTQSTYKPEQHLMASSMRELFGSEIEVPSTLAGPCCSQFSVSRSAIHRRSRAEYKHYMDWIIDSEESDAVTGRVFEHLWPYMFLESKAVDCPIAWKTLCKMYRICFEGGEKGLEKYQKVWDARRAVDGNITFSRELFGKPNDAETLRVRSAEYTKWLHEKLHEALKRGEDEGIRGSALGDLEVPR